MSSHSETSEYDTPKHRTLSEFDRGSFPIFNYFPPLTRTDTISTQLLVFSLLEVFSLNLSGNEPTKSRHIFQLLLYFLEKSKVLPTSMTLSAKPIQQLPLFKDYVRMLQEIIQQILCLVQTNVTSSSTKHFAHIP
mgnify:CR=1 FL=1